MIGLLRASLPYVAGGLCLATAPLMLVLGVVVLLFSPLRPVEVTVFNRAMVISPWASPSFDGGIIIGARCYSPRQAFGEDI